MFIFQEFDDPRDADDAVYELNGKELLGERWNYIPIYIFPYIKTLEIYGGAVAECDKHNDTLPGCLSEVYLLMYILSLYYEMFVGGKVFILLFARI